MADLSGACAVARPVVARMVRRVGKGASIRLRAGQDVVAGRQGVTNAIDEFALFGQCEFFCQVAAAARFIQGVSVYFGLDERSVEPAAQIVREPLLRIEPGTRSDTVSCVDGRLTGPGPSAQVRAPRLPPAPTAVASAWQCASAPANPPRFPWAAAFWRAILGVNERGRLRLPQRLEIFALDHRRADRGSAAAGPCRMAS